MSSVSSVIAPALLVIIVVPCTAFLMWFTYNLFREVRRNKVTRRARRGTSYH